MINLAIITRDEKYLQQLTNCLHREEDISLLNTIIIKNLKSEMKQAIAFVKQIIEQRPDILLLDQSILRDAAAMNMQQILKYRDNLINTKVIIVGQRYNEENVMVMIEAGARGFFRTALGDKLLIKCIRMVALGEIWLEAVLFTWVFEELRKEVMEKKNRLKSLANLRSAKLKILTPREMEVLALISESMTNEEIAQKLFLSVKTVKTHMRNIFAKANIRNRVEAALMYSRHAQIPH
jgi:DNA-binding NarL/FixJ family response regulator